MRMGPLGVGLGWRDSLAGFTVDRAGVDMVEVLAEHVPDLTRRGSFLPPALALLRRRGVQVVVHGLELSLGGADRLDPHRLRRLAALAEAVDAPVVTEHAAYTRAGRRSAGHLLPLPRTREALAVLTANVRTAQAELPVPLAVENPASVLAWPGAELDEASFLTELVERTGCWLLLDVANLVADEHNHGLDPGTVLDCLPLERIAYVHVAGGHTRDGLYFDTHRHPVPERVWEVLAELQRRVAVPGVILEWDADFPPEDHLRGELDMIRRIRAGTSAPARGAPSPDSPRPAPPPPTGPSSSSLARVQRELLRALTDPARPAPPGFDPHRVAAAAGILTARRRHRSRRGRLSLRRRR